MDAETATEPDGDPLVVYDASWSHQMRGARKVARMSQEQLARAVGVSQPVISTIERGGTAGLGGSSIHIMAICRALKIPPPTLSDDPRLRRWRAVGVALLRAPQMFDAQIEALEVMVKMMDANPDSDSQHGQS